LYNAVTAITGAPVGITDNTENVSYLANKLRVPNVDFAGKFSGNFVFYNDVGTSPD